MIEEITTNRTPELIGAEIRTITQQAKYMALLYGVEVGRRLNEAKELLPHGQWLPWLEKETEFSPATASRFMKLLTNTEPIRAAFLELKQIRQR